ncbi:hypothetical protein PR048_023525 [Dryococelus australis]|uniref:YqaJ viral recombinase domain-containing protein n=1 Tax=Dryococelus australis TaxID=614101 RepID=A0ABQ9GUB8_9NEOP|nr:hypothetical protein PR048_023525 [Dryococelus australis]
MQCLDILLRKAGRLTENITQNVAENYIDAYQHDCLGAVLYHSTGSSYIVSPWKMLTGQVEEEMEGQKKSVLDSFAEEVDCEEKCLLLERKTLRQHDNPLWFEARCKRLAASHFPFVYNIWQTTSCHNIVKSVLIYQEIFSKAIQYGQMNEKRAILCYEERKGVTVGPCGLFVRPNLPYLGASSDAIVGDEGLVEVKCLPSIGTTIKKVAKAGKIPCVHYIGEELCLKNSHRYWHQIQGQLMISKRGYCDLIIYSELGI